MSNSDTHYLHRKVISPTTTIRNIASNANPGFAATIPSLPFPSDQYDSLPTQPSVTTVPAHHNNESKKYKSASRMNSPRSQVRFSIPITDDIDPDDSNRSISTSPSKIVFPKEPTDSGSDTEPESESSITPSLNNDNSSNSGQRQLDEIQSARAAIQGHVVDMQSKIMVNVPQEIWSFHNERLKHNNSTHQRVQSMQNVSMNYDNKSATTISSNKGHHRSRSLQSLISQTVNEFSNNYNNNNLKAINAEHSSISINDSQLSQVSPLNFPSSNNSNLKLGTPNSKSTNLYLTSDSPINKHKVPIPLEISLPPFLSPSNKNKKRNSLIYDGESYSVFNDKEDSLMDSVSECNSSSEIVTDSILSNSSIASITYNISFDANIMNPDEILGIDKDANVNLKDQFKNLKRQKAVTTGRNQHYNVNNLPPVPKISLEQQSTNTKDITQKELTSSIPITFKGSPERNTQPEPHSILKHNIQLAEPSLTEVTPALTKETSADRLKSPHVLSGSKDYLAPHYSPSQPNTLSGYISPTHARLSKLLDEYNSPSQKLSPDNNHLLNVNSSSRKTNIPNDSLVILATPSKSIVIPDLDNIQPNTPNNLSTSFTPHSHSNGTLKFFDQFMPLHSNENGISSVNHSIPRGQLDTAFKFPKQNNNYIDSNNGNKYIQQEDKDYNKTPQGSAQFEKRRQKLLASHLSPNNKIGHAHRRSRSIHNMDFVSPQKILEVSLPPTPPLPINATSTPPSNERNILEEIPLRSSIEINTPSKTIPEKLHPEVVHPRAISHGPLKFHDKETTTPVKLQQIKPLSSFQSFSTPIKKMNFVPDIKADDVKQKAKSHNLLSPRRQLSNSESEQSSNANSQFSKNSRVTQLTESTEISSSNFRQRIKPRFPINDIAENNADFKIIKERQKDGYFVDVIVLDDDTPDDAADNLYDNIKPSKKYFNNKSSAMNKEKNVPTHHSPKKNKGQFKKRYTYETKEEQLENYKELLAMCENTATIAKETIFALAGAAVTTKNNTNQ